MKKLIKNQNLDKPNTFKIDFTSQDKLTKYISYNIDFKSST